MKPKSAKQKSSKDQEALHFRYFILGAVTFLVGIGTVVYVNLLLPPSTEQEIYALIGLCLGLPAGCVAFYCYLRLLFSRLQNFFKNH